ncbi:hypothetical protein F8M41_022491 [Gigaspora margarita]|uniref:Uncharacterized protein n=1 Tax=Gigaspora margarita TaxID=4874 RepID=A0A8H4EHY0_GIGMA|nr:hypothetical protein F8M41_022491 [Gigaspora margarita]
MEILFYRYMLKNQKKHDKKYKTIKEIEESSTKELTTINEPFDNHSKKELNDNKKNDEKLRFSQPYKIRNRITLSFYRFNRSIIDFAEPNKYLTYEFQSLQATKMNDADLLNKLNMLYDTIEDIKLQLKELRVLVEGSIKESGDLVKKFRHSEEDLEKDLESLRVDHCQLKKE